MENVFDEIIKMLSWWFFRSHSKCKLGVKKSIIGFILNFSSKNWATSIWTVNSPSVPDTGLTTSWASHELGIYLSHNFEEWNPWTQKFDSNGKYVMDKQARDIKSQVKVNDYLFLWTRKVWFIMYCMQMSRLEPWNTIETQLLIEYLCNMNHNKNIGPLQHSHSWGYRVWLCLVSSVLVSRDCECRKYLRVWDFITRLSSGALPCYHYRLIWFILSS